MEIAKRSMAPDNAHPEEGSVLAKVLWGQVARVVHARPPRWDPGCASARAILAVLEEGTLAAEEELLFRGWRAEHGSTSQLYDRLLETRVNRAMRAALELEARTAGLEHLPRPPRVAIARSGGEGTAPPTASAILHSTGIAGIAELEPGAALADLVDVLVLANRDAFEELKTATPREVEADFRVEAAGVEEDLLAGQTTPVRVFELERALSRVEQVLRAAIPEAERPPEAGWSFGTDLTGKLLGGKYRIKALKGIGGFKAVYEAVDEMLGARVALAVLKPRGARSRHALLNFRREAQLLTSLDHENIVRWITFDRTDEGLHYFVMEYLGGEELEALLRREGRMAPERVGAILLQVLAALRRAHKLADGSALLHLDLKPENVFLLPALGPGEPERVKVIDFGIGQHVGAEVRAADQPALRSIFELSPEELGRSIGSFELPEEGDAAAVLAGGVPRARGGTLLYASPEQCRHLAGEADIVALDARSDLYSLGVTAFRMLSGEFPWVRCDSAHAAIRNHLEVPPRRLSELGVRVPRRLAAFVERCLEKDREKRFRDAGEAFEFLEAYVHPRASPLAVAAPVVLVAAAAVGYALWSRPSEINAITAIDPGSRAAVQRLDFGPATREREVLLPSWSAGESDLELVDVVTGKTPSGWRARWREAVSGRLAIETDPELSPAGFRARLRLDADGQRWDSEPFDLGYLGAWTIDGLEIAGHRDGRALDPRGRTLALLLGGDARGRAEIVRLELWNGDELVASEQEPRRSELANATRQGNLPLEALAGREGPVILSARAIDRAEQEHRQELALELAAAPAAFTSGLGFVETADAVQPRALPSPGDVYALVPGNGLRLALSARGSVRLQLELEGAAAPPERTFVIERAPFERVLSLEELGLPRAGALSGSVRLAAEDSTWVDRAQPSVDRRALRFRYEPAPPALSAELSTPAGGRSVRLEVDAGPAYVNLAGRTELAVRVPPSPSRWIRARLEPPGGDALLLEEKSDVNGVVRFALELPASGECTLSIRPHLVLDDGTLGSALGPELVFPLRIDTKPPTLELAPSTGERTADGELLVRAVDPRLGLRFSDGSPIVEAVWKLAGPGGLGGGGELALSGSESEGSELDLWPLLAERTGAFADGDYRLEVSVTDAAGNREPRILAFEVARAGPTIELEDPEPRAEGERSVWFLSERELWNLRARVRDPNGVGRVSARLFLEDAAEPFIAAPLEPRAGDLYVLSDPPPTSQRYGGRSVRIELDAEDGRGVPAPSAKHEALVPALPTLVEQRIVPAAGTGSAMVFQAGNAGFEYVFGGRRELDGSRSFHVTIPEDALRSFYLDAREVSAGEYRAFVEDPGGYREPRHWPAGVAPREERRTELAGRLVPDERAVTGLTWAEAWAFARWRGKRLPSLLEWEYVVRGGREYRGECDESGARGVTGLGAAPSEWTSTPQRLVAGASDFAAQCRANIALLLAPDESTFRDDTHWVAAGPTWEDALLRSSRAERSYPDVGFRCAVDAELAWTWLDQGRFRVKE